MDDASAFVAMSLECREDRPPASGVRFGLLQQSLSRLVRRADASAAAVDVERRRRLARELERFGLQHLAISTPPGIR
ncbi:MAG: hypothetical protein M3N49_05230 [Candidatus Eremiobacteraeota bacterium]|nr:hypothetical protein [Candidatus Eremiobacteraeota bacterium]